jgi:hypothetical protein
LPVTSVSLRPDEQRARRDRLIPDRAFEDSGAGVRLRAIALRTLGAMKVRACLLPEGCAVAAECDLIRNMKVLLTCIKLDQP